MSFVDDLVNNTKNAIEDAKKLQAVIAPAGTMPTNTSPLPPPRSFGGGLTLSNPLVIVGGIIAAVVLWKILKK